MTLTHFTMIYGCEQAEANISLPVSPWDVSLDAHPLQVNTIHTRRAHAAFSELYAACCMQVKQLSKVFEGKAALSSSVWI
jgi:hypothetical protein